MIRKFCKISILIIIFLSSTIIFSQDNTDLGIDLPKGVKTSDVIKVIPVEEYQGKYDITFDNEKMSMDMFFLTYLPEDG